MVRWYDYIAAGFFADFIVGFAVAAYNASATGIFYTLFFLALSWLIYDFWLNIYCKIRLASELRKRE